MGHYLLVWQVGLSTLKLQTHSLDADSFIQSLRHFIARCGSIRTLWSDSGTNFVGAEKELWLLNRIPNSKIFWAQRVQIR